MGTRAPGMTFEPRTAVGVPSAFGRVSAPLPPAQGFDKLDHRYRAAMIQHKLADMIHDALRLRGQTLPQFLAAAPPIPGLSPDRQRRMLRGETAAQFADLAFWASVFPKIATDIAEYIGSWPMEQIARREEGAGR
ncbi:hypothetical protein RS85_03415 [Microbacterium sp. SA39]|nr:hypothetical protein RS85_03415 [Microbacterium sp. SA39]